MGKSKKKEKYVPLTGLTGIGEDYNIYIMAPREKIIGYLIGFVAGFLAAQIMFGVVIASIVIGAAVPAGKTPEGDPAAIPGYAGLAEQLLLCR